MPLVDLRSQAIRRTPEEVVQHLKRFRLELKFSAGVWYFSPAANRFHATYGTERNIAERLGIAARLHSDGLVGLEAHYPNEINEENLPLWQSFLADTGMRLVNVVPLLFWDAQFEGGPSPTLWKAPAGQPSNAPGVPWN